VNQTSPDNKDRAAETPADIAALSFEQAMAELNEIVQKLESGEAPLEDAIGTYERGMALKAHCEKKLNEAQRKIEQIRLSADGTPAGTEPFSE